MNILHFLRSVVRTPSRNKGRATLMMAGVTIGIASLTILTSIGESTRRETMKRFKNMLGTFDTVIIRPGSSKNRGMVSLTSVDPTLKFEDAAAIATQVPEIRQVAQIQNALDIDVKYRDHSGTPAIFGVTANFLDLRGDEVEQGDFITDEDVRTLAKVAVLGADARKQLFPDEDPLGKTIQIGDVPFVVRGVMVARGAGPAGGSLDNLIFIPVTTASKRLFNRDFLTMLIAQLKDPADGQLAIDHIQSLLRTRHHIAPGALDDFNLTNPKAVMEQVTTMGSTIRKLLLAVAVLATGIGGIVIMSIMLIGVSERRKEIGVRRAVRRQSRGDPDAVSARSDIAVSRRRDHRNSDRRRGNPTCIPASTSSISSAASSSSVGGGTFSCIRAPVRGLPCVEGGNDKPHRSLKELAGCEFCGFNKS